MLLIRPIVQAGEMGDVHVMERDTLPLEELECR